MSAPWARRLIGRGPNTTPPFRSQAKAFSAIGTTDPWSLSTRSAHPQAPRPTRRLARRQTLSEQLARRLPTGLSARSPRSKAQQAARPPTFRALSTARALVLSRFPLFWHKFTVVNDDGCLRKSLPYLRNSVNWGLLASIFFLPFRPTYFHQSRHRCFADRANADAPLPASPCPPSRRRRRATRLSGGRTARLSL